MGCWGLVGNTLQYFVLAWLATSLLGGDGLGLQLDYYAYGSPWQAGPPLGGFCEQYQAQGYYDVVRHLPAIDAALRAKGPASPMRLPHLYAALKRCSRCSSSCSFPGVGPSPSKVYCDSPCTDDFLECLLGEIRGDVFI